MERMSERVARAILKLRRDHPAPADPELTEWADAWAKALRETLAAEGLVVVPREPTGAMLGATVDGYTLQFINYCGDDRLCEIYRAMIAAGEVDETP